MASVVTDWLGFRAAVVSAVEAAMPPAVLARTGVAWADGPRPAADKNVLLSVVSTTYADRDSAESEGGPQVLESMVTPTVQITTESPFDSGDADALWLIEQLRLGLRKVSVREALEAAGVVIQVFPASSRNIGGVVDGHAMSVHAIEVVFCTTFGLAPDEDAGLVEHVAVAGSVQDDAGVELEFEVTIDDPSPEP